MARNCIIRICPRIVLAFKYRQLVTYLLTRGTPMTTIIPDAYQQIVRCAFEHWIPGASILPLKSLDGGRSGASVLLLDVKYNVEVQQLNNQIPPGQHVLKLDLLATDGANESDRHTWIEARSPVFAQAHMPHLLGAFPQDSKIALLYRIAGSNLALITTAEHMKSLELQDRLAQLATSLVKELNSRYEVEQGVAATQTLRDWLGYRLHPLSAPILHNFIQAETGGAPVFTYGTYVLINPIWLCTCEFIASDNSHVRFIGAYHGDLNCRNILLNRQPFMRDFWIIDFARAGEGPLFYDESYLELDILLNHLQGVDPERMLSILFSLDTDPMDPHSRNIHLSDDGIVSCCRKVREATRQAWIQKEDSRQTALFAQQILARIAAAINFANKPSLDDISKRLAIAYGGYFARSYLESFHKDKFQLLLAGKRAEAYRNVGTQQITSITRQADSPEWMEVWNQLGRFDDTTSKYILVLPPIHNLGPDLAALGMVPWSLVLDMDPESDKSGALNVIESVLSNSRRVIKFGKTPIEALLDKGTAWAMVAGWPSHGEPIPTTLREWRQVYLPAISQVARSLKKQFAPIPLKVLIIASEQSDPDKLTRIVERLDEEFGSAAEFIAIGDRRIAEAASVHRFVNVSTSGFLLGLSSVVGKRDNIEEPEIPSKDGSTKLGLLDLRNLEEDCTVLHSLILQTSGKQNEMSDDFWRGSRPTWYDLHAGVDIRRQNLGFLLEALRKALGSSENSSVAIYHTPGAGGTTAALRAAWELKSDFPTVLLHKLSALTADRLESLYKICQKPLLILADASIMNDHERSELLSTLGKTYVKAAILHTIRSSRPDKTERLNIIDPLSNSEASKFFTEYSARTIEPKRRRQLELITKSDDPMWVRYRSPFFYGLITYERGYKRIDKYVSSHVGDIEYTTKKLIVYLALVTRYSQLGLPQSLFLRILEKNADSTFDPDAEFGDRIARLVVMQNGALRLIHPLLAEEVLNQLIGNGDGDAWKDSLADTAIEFLGSVSAHAEEGNRDLSDVLSEVFISRETWWAGADGGSRKLQFSELIESIPSPADQHRVFLALNKAFPKDAHYWNHLGRHHIYKMEGHFEEAEKCLLTAVELAPMDPLHYHTLGLVRRFWVEDILRKASRSKPKPDAVELLGLVKTKVEAAIENFTKGRELDEYNDHCYITHIQMQLTVIEALLNAFGVDKINLLKDVPRSVGTWLKESLALIEDLLDRRDRLVTSGAAFLVQNCLSRLKVIYGDFRAVIKMWEAELAKGGEGTSVRRALSTVYLAQNNRLWAKVPVPQLQRVVDMMRENLKIDPGNERDLRMWFQAYRRLPEFSFLDAMGRLETWAARSGSLDAYYYLYILHFLRWNQGIEASEIATLDLLSICRSKALGRQCFIYEWFGSGPAWCPLVSDVDRKLENGSSDYSKPCKLLGRIEGVIEHIEGGYAGTIRIGQHLRAFFAPGDRFRASKNQNDIVNFYLGFRYDGLRAWAVESGHIATEKAGEKGA